MCTLSLDKKKIMRVYIFIEFRQKLYLKDNYIHKYIKKFYKKYLKNKYIYKTIRVLRLI